MVVITVLLMTLGSESYDFGASLVYKTHARLMNGSSSYLSIFEFLLNLFIGYFQTPF